LDVEERILFHCFAATCDLTQAVEENDNKNIKNQNCGTTNFSALIHHAEFEQVCL